MNATELLGTLSRRGILLSAVGDRLRVDAPRAAANAELRATLAAAKAELLAELREKARQPIFLDFETRSLAPLREVGGRRYALHPSTEVLCMVARMPDGTIVEWTRGDAPPTSIFKAVESGVPLVAHNAIGFDKFMWRMLGWPPATWIDTMKLAGLAGLPRKLEDIAQQLLGREKDKVGRRVTLQLGRPGKDGRLRPVTPEQMTTVVGYCRSDVELLAEAWRVRLGRWLEVESDVRALDVQINERGFLFDVELAQGIIECEAEALAKLSEQLRIDPAIVRSSPKLISALAQSGVRVDNIRNETLEPLLADPSLPPEARRLIGARVAYIGMATPKLRAALARLDVDGRLKDTLVFHGAHTGRWSGQGFQPQNLPHGARDLNVETAVRAALARDHERLQALAQELQVTVTDVTAKLVRACVIAPASKLLAVVDYSSVEPRALAWVAGNESRLKDFRDGVDIYKPMASKILGVPVDKLTKAQRNVGKPPELGCGYGMGGSRFGEYAESFGVAWSVMPMTPEQVVEMWRDENPLVAGVRDTPFGGRRGGLWQRLENAALRACQGERVTVACTAWERDGEDVVCILPSGRRMVYRCALGERVQTRWGSTREAMTFLMVDKGRVVRKSTYGGLLTENVIQAICRDVLVDAMLRLDPAGFELVLHVHDEPVAEVTDAARLEKMKEILATPPAWAAGLPLAVEGYVSRRYRGK